MMREWLTRSVGEMAKALRNGKISSQELVAAHIARILETHLRINAAATIAEERALKVAATADESLVIHRRKRTPADEIPPLLGVPITIKDNLETEGIVSTGGTKGRASYVPDRDATVVARLRAAGAIIIAKSTTPELTMAYETASLIHGVTSNPYDAELTPGGSSGGAAALIAVGGSPLDIGSDTGGSIRVPSHFCGVTGLKPTTEAVPKEGHIFPAGSLSDRMTAIGPMARCCGDLELAFGIIRNPGATGEAVARAAHVDVSRLRIAFYVEDNAGANGKPAHPTDPSIISAIHCATDMLRTSGATVTLATPAPLARAFDLTLGLWTADGGRALRKLLADSGTTEFHPFMQTVLEVCRGGERDAAGQSALLEEWNRFQADMGQFIDPFDLVISPVLPFPALRHGLTFAPEYFPAFRHTMLHNLTGWPVVTIRAGTTDAGLPVGIQIAARPWREDVALAVGKWLEERMSLTSCEIM